MYVLANKL